MKWIILLILLLPMALAFDGESASYDIDSYHYGLAGSEGDSASYVTRSTTTYQQGSTGDASSSSYTMNVGHFSEEELAGDTTDPTITLNYPGDAAILINGSIDFNASVSDNLGIANVTLYGNWPGSWQAITVNSSGINNIDYIFNATIPEGIWEWNMEVCDISGNCAFATANNTITIDLSDPTATLISPSNNSTWTPSNTILFEFNTTDAIGVDYAELYIDGIFVLNHTTIINGTNSFTRQLSNGNYNWSVIVYDLSGRSTQSSTYDLTVDVSTGGGGSGGDPSYDIGREEIPLIFEDVDREIKFSDSHKKLLIWFLVVYFWWIIFGKRRKEKKPHKNLFVR